MAVVVLCVAFVFWCLVDCVYYLSDLVWGVVLSVCLLLNFFHFIGLCKILFHVVYVFSSPDLIGLRLKLGVYLAHAFLLKNLHLNM